MFLLFSFFKEWGVWGRETHGCEKHPSVASLHAPRPGREPETQVYICPGPGVEPDTFLFYRMTLQCTEPPRLGCDHRVLADWSLLAAGRVGRMVACRVSHCTACRTQASHPPCSTRRTSSQAADWWEPLLLLGSWIVLLCLGCSWPSPGTHLLDCFTQQPFPSYSQILVTCYHDPAICVFQKVWNLHSKGCLFKNIYIVFKIDFREEERRNGVIPHPSGSLRKSAGQRWQRAWAWGLLAWCGGTVSPSCRVWTVGWERGDEVSRTPGLGRGSWLGNRGLSR